MNEILTIKNLKKNYHNKVEVKAVENFSFTLKNGDFIAIVGPSGCGKSTILSILADLETKSSGTITVKENLNIGYMLQSDGLFDWLTVLDNCLLGLKINKKLNDKNKQHVLSLLTSYDLKEFVNSYPNNLSGGMRQRVALIRTLATKPDLLLMDEPFSALDYHSRLKVSNDVYNIIKKENKSVIMVTHDIAEAISMADKVLVLTKRPTKIKNIYNIKYKDKKNPIENRNSDEFRGYYETIWKDIDSYD